MKRLRRWLRRTFRPQTVLMVRPGFFCERHWRFVTDSWGTSKPINPYWMMAGITVWLQGNGYPAEPTPNACCLLSDEQWLAIMDLSRNRL